MKIGRRPPAIFLQRLADPNNYAALARMFSVHRNPVRTVLDEVFSRGAYPRTVSIKTPVGPLDVRLFSPADLSTLNLIFCREDYYIPQDARVVVDIGSNIGLSTLFWLTRNRSTFIHCYEPSPASFQRLEENLRAYSGRVSLHKEAVSDFSGTARFGMEASGVHSSLDLASENSVECRVLHINEVLETALKLHGTIDVLKIDSEGHEMRTLKAIDPAHWGRIRCVNVDDAPEAESVVPKEFRHSHVSSAHRFRR